MVRAEAAAKRAPSATCWRKHADLCASSTSRSGPRTIFQQSRRQKRLPPAREGNSFAPPISIAAKDPSPMLGRRRSHSTTLRSSETIGLSPTQYSARSRKDDCEQTHRFAALPVRTPALRSFSFERGCEPRARFVIQEETIQNLEKRIASRSGSRTICAPVARCIAQAGECSAKDGKRGSIMTARR